MRNNLPKNPQQNECFIYNIDDKDSSGTHWTCVYISNSSCKYFDSFGFSPPLELQQYLSIFNDCCYNTFELQHIHEVICGHLCIYVLYQLQCGYSFYEILSELYKRFKKVYTYIND